MYFYEFLIFFNLNRQTHATVQLFFLKWQTPVLTTNHYFFMNFGS
jgi:hypothetical protein